MERLRGDRTQRSVAQRAGINRSSWSSYEAGRRMPGPPTYIRIARGLECSEEELDRAVLRAWNERLRGEMDGGDPPWPALTGTAGDVPTGLALTDDEALTLAASSERIHDVVRRVLQRHPPSE